jgi:cytochrome c biogenesis protein CcmG/thiol:disulfide interchange protein DsbE
MDTDSKNDVVPFVKENGINYHVGYANPEVVQAYGGIESIPTSFVINKNGKIVDKHEGLVPKSDFTNVLNKLLHKS